MAQWHSHTHTHIHVMRGEHIYQHIDNGCEFYCFANGYGSLENPIANDCIHFISFLFYFFFSVKCHESFVHIHVPFEINRRQAATMPIFIFFFFFFICKYFIWHSNSIEFYAHNRILFFVFQSTLRNDNSIESNCAQQSM